MNKKTVTPKKKSLSTVSDVDTDAVLAEVYGPRLSKKAQAIADDYVQVENAVFYLSPEHNEMFEEQLHKQPKTREQLLHNLRLMSVRADHLASTVKRLISEHTD